MLNTSLCSELEIERRAILAELALALEQPLPSGRKRRSGFNVLRGLELLLGWHSHEPERKFPIARMTLATNSPSAEKRKGFARTWPFTEKQTRTIVVTLWDLGFIYPDYVGTGYRRVKQWSFAAEYQLRLKAALPTIPDDYVTLEEAPLDASVFLTGQKVSPSPLRKNLKPQEKVSGPFEHPRPVQKVREPCTVEMPPVECKGPRKLPEAALPNLRCLGIKGLDDEAPEPKQPLPLPMPVNIIVPTYLMADREPPLTGTSSSYLLQTNFLNKPRENP